MKKTYIIPQTMVEVTVTEQVLATSILNKDSDNQEITLTDEEYDDEFNVKECCNFDW